MCEYKVHLNYLKHKGLLFKGTSPVLSFEEKKENKLRGDIYGGPEVQIIMADHKAQECTTKQKGK